MQYSSNLLTGAKIPEGLLFPPQVLASLNATRTWSAREEDFPAGQGVLGPTLTASTLEILLCAGLAYGRGTPADPEVWYAAAADLGLLTRDATLRLVASTMRETRTPSEHFGEAVAHLVLFKHYGIKHIARARPFLDGEPGTGAFQGKSVFRPGDGGDQPDYFCLDGDGKVVIAEAKGTTGVRALSTQLKHGVEQVDAVEPIGCQLRPEPNRLVVGTHFPVEGKPEGNATTVVRDPNGGHEPVRVEVTADMIIRQSLAGALRVAGYVPEALCLLNGERQTSRFQGLRQNGGERLGIWDAVPLAPLVGDWWLTLTPHVWEAIRGPLDGFGAMRWPEYSAQENSVTLPNGFGIARQAPGTQEPPKVFIVGRPHPSEPNAVMAQAVDELTQHGGILSPGVLLPYAQARRRLVPGALLTQEELCFCWLRRTEVDLNDQANRDLLVRSALRRPATLFLWLSQLQPHDAVLAGVLLSSPFDSDRDVSDSSSSLLEVGALALSEHDLEALVAGMRHAGYSHFQNALAAWNGAEEQRERTMERVRLARLDGRHLARRNSADLLEASDQLAKQILAGLGTRTITAAVMDVGRAIVLRNWGIA